MWCYLFRVACNAYRTHHSFDSSLAVLALLNSVADLRCSSRIRIFPSRIDVQKGTVSQIRIAWFAISHHWIELECNYFSPKKLLLSSLKHDPGCLSRIRIFSIPDPDPSSRYQKGTGSRIRMHNILLTVIIIINDSYVRYIYNKWLTGQ